MRVCDIWAIQAEMCARTPSWCCPGSECWVACKRCTAVACSHCICLSSSAQLSSATHSAFSYLKTIQISGADSLPFWGHAGEPTPNAAQAPMGTAMRVVPDWRQAAQTCSCPFPAAFWCVQGPLRQEVCHKNNLEGCPLAHMQGLQDPRGAHAVRAAGCHGRGRPPAQAAAGAAGD